MNYTNNLLKVILQYFPTTISTQGCLFFSKSIAKFTFSIIISSIMNKFMMTKYKEAAKIICDVIVENYIPRDNQQ